MAAARACDAMTPGSCEWWERPGSGGVGAKHLRTGKWPRARMVEEPSLDVGNDDGPTVLRIAVRPADRVDGAGFVEDQSPVVEEDLCVQDCCDSPVDTDDLLLHVPSASTGRRLMQERARQCVVCLCEKEHTFVPPHVGDSDETGTAKVQDHRFCTECWASFVLHGYKSKASASNDGSSAKAMKLRCPVCRGGIQVPDVWNVSLGFKQPSLEAAVAAASQGYSSRDDDAAAETPTRVHPVFWAERRTTLANTPPQHSVKSSHDNLSAESADIELDIPLESYENADPKTTLAARFLRCLRGVRCCQRQQPQEGTPVAASSSHNVVVAWGEGTV